MSKKIIPSAFGSAFIALSLTAFIMIFAACGSGSGGEEESSSSVGRPSSSSLQLSSISGDIVEQFTIEARLDGLRHEKLIYGCYVHTTSVDYPIDSVVITVGNKRIDKKNASGNKRTIDIAEELYEFPNLDNCDNNEFDVCAAIYINASRSPTGGCLSPKLKRDVAKCNPPSSSSVSSSSVAAKNFSPLGDFALNSNSGDRGVILSTSTATSNLSQADIYFDATGSDKFKTEKNTVKILDAVFDVTCDGRFYPNDNMYYGSTPDCGIVPTPQSTSQFILNPSVDAQNSKESAYSSGLYYLIRTGGSGVEWTSSDYLMRVLTPVSGTTNKSLEVRIWKID